jgi:hypothetical protein
MRFLELKAGFGALLITLGKGVQFKVESLKVQSLGF